MDAPEQREKLGKFLSRKQSRETGLVLQHFPSKLIECRLTRDRSDIYPVGGGL